MVQKISFLAIALLVISSCVTQYQKDKNTPKIVYRGQKRPISSEVEKKTKAIIDQKLSTYENQEEDYHEVPPAVPVTAAVTEKYIESYKEISMVEMQRYKIPASITLAQAILESGSGQGRLARHGNNHFGIKCHSAWKGKTLTHDDDEKGECFRRYKYAYESFEDHSAFLVNRARYASLFELSPGDYEAWAHGLKKAGYATDPEYAKKLIFLIKKHKLYEYDNLVLKTQQSENKQVTAQKTEKTTPIITPKTETTEKKPQTAVIKEEKIVTTIQKPVEKIEKAVQTTTTVVDKVQKSVQSSTTIIAQTIDNQQVNDIVSNTLTITKTTAEVTVDNIIKATTKTENVTTPTVAIEAKKVITNPLPTYYVVKSGDTLYKIAKEQKVPVEQLIKLNSFNEQTSNSLYIGQEIRLN